MLDPLMIKLVKHPLDVIAGRLAGYRITPDRITVAGFVAGLAAFGFIWANWMGAALFLILLNRIMDGLDGALARHTGKTDAGGFLDICLDFIFYSLVIVGFALADPESNALAAALLIFSFVGTGTSFLAFAALAARRNITSIAYPHKSLYYMGGLTEGTETILFLVLICLFPRQFPVMAVIFSILCAITTVTRILSGYSTLKTATRCRETLKNDTNK
jgi:phosphatidylglycerophosphate synthase